MDTNIINSIFSVFAEANPEPKTELLYTNHYTLLVAVILSAQATDIGVNKATPALFKIAGTPEKMVHLGIEKLKTYIKTIGLYHTKAKNIIAMSEQLIAKHHSQVPDDLNALVQLPGVGIKTANVVLNCAFGHPTIAVDTHVFRVSNRLGLVKTTSPNTTGSELLKVIPAQWLQHAHHWLILHGRYICKAQRPLCGSCPVYQWCEFGEKEKFLTSVIPPR
jgi:endonuclease III